MSTPSQPSDWDLARVLGESTRRRVFEAVRAAGRPVTRDDVAAGAHINRRLAAFHLDRLAASGLVSVDYAHPADRPPGPGAGRPAKRYQAVAVQLDLSLPARHYDLAARILARGIDTEPTDATEGVLRAAREEGLAQGKRQPVRPRASLANRVSRLRDGFAALGYEPRTEDGCVHLGNCPFRSVADVAPQLVCGMNRAFIEGFVDGSNTEPADVALEPPTPPNCCVTVSLRSAALS